MHICSLLISGIHILKGPLDLIADANKEGRIRSFPQYHFSFGSQPIRTSWGRKQNPQMSEAQRSCSYVVTEGLCNLLFLLSCPLFYHHYFSSRFLAHSCASDPQLLEKSIPLINYYKIYSM